LRLKLGFSTKFTYKDAHPENLWTKEWEIFVDGSAYFGQINEDEEKDGLGKEISILGTYRSGYFDEDEFIHGLVINQDGTYYFYDKNSSINTLRECEEPENCHTKHFYFNNKNRYQGILKNGVPHGMGHYFFNDSD
jgi:hypothetical protein